MTAEQTEIFHYAVLRVLDQNGTRFGLGTQALTTLIGQFGFTVGCDQVGRACEYMADEENGYVKLVNKGQFNPANRAWQITAKGTNLLRERGY